jgi:hypothetical protein
MEKPHMPAVKVFSVIDVPVYGVPGDANSVNTIPAGTIVTDQAMFERASWRGKICEFILVTYTVNGNEHTGWAYRGCFDHIAYEFDPGVVSINTLKDPMEPNQHIYAERTGEYNVCGELCAARILGQDLATVLSQWHQKPMSWFERHIFTARERGTTVVDLAIIFDKFEVLTEKLSRKLTDPILGEPVFTPAHLAPLLVASS